MSAGTCTWYVGIQNMTSSATGSCILCECPTVFIQSLKSFSWMHRTGCCGAVHQSRLHLENVVFALVEWIEDSALAGAPLASYAATQQETYRDPQTGPTVPSAMGQKRKFFSLGLLLSACPVDRYHTSLNPRWNKLLTWFSHMPTHRCAAVLSQPCVFSGCQHLLEQLSIRSLISTLGRIFTVLPSILLLVLP